MMSSIALNTNSPRLLCHSKDESPSLLRVQVSVGEDEETLILVEFDILLQIIKDLASVKLLDFGVVPYPRGDNTPVLKNLKTLFKLVLAGWIVWVLS